MGRRAPRRHDRFPRAARRERHARADRRAVARSTSPSESVLAAVAARAEGNPSVRRGDGPSPRRGGGRKAAELPATVQALLAARLDSLEPFQRRLLAHAAVIGRTFWEGALAPRRRGRGRRSGGGAARAAREGHHRRGRGQRAGRRAGARVQARADPRRRLRDAAEGRTGTEALRGRALHRAARRASASRRSWHCSPSTTAERPQLGGELGLDPTDELSAYRAKALQFLEAAGDAASALLLKRRRRFPTTRRPRSQASDDPTTVAQLARSRAMSRCASAASTPRSRSGSRHSSTHTRPGGSRARRRASPQDRRRRSRTRESASRRSSTTSGAST